MSTEEPQGPSADPRHLRDVPKDAREFQGERAGIVSRALANIVDFLVVMGIVVGLWVGWNALLFLVDPRRTDWPQPGLLLLVLVGGWVQFLYFTASWATTGRTAGNHLLGLRVVSFRGLRMRWAGAADPGRVLCAVPDRTALDGGQPAEPLGAGLRAAHLGHLRLGHPGGCRFAGPAGPGDPEGQLEELIRGGSPWLGDPGGLCADDRGLARSDDPAARAHGGHPWLRTST